MPEPDPVRLNTVETLPETRGNASLTVRQGEHEAMADLPVLLRLADQGMIQRREVSFCVIDALGSSAGLGKACGPLVRHSASARTLPVFRTGTGMKYRASANTGKASQAERQGKKSVSFQGSGGSNGSNSAFQGLEAR